jgi:hypothetical protein
MIMLGISLSVLSCSTAQPSVLPSSPDTKFITMMETNLKILDTAQAPATFIMLANTFERIGNAEKKYWQPWYYASLCYALMAMNADKTMIDPLTSKAEGFLEKANELNSNNSEISALQGMIINTKILADPMNRWQTYSVQAGAMLTRAREQDPLNPRPYLIEARTKLFTPVAMGGGPDAAKPIIEKALANFKEFKQENSIAPAWGLRQTEKLLAKVNGK